MTGHDHDSFTCPECVEWPDALRFARSAFLLEEPADRLVHQLKYRGWRGLATPMGELMAKIAWPAEAHAPAMIVPVPTTRRRERERGYNQAELLARSLGRATACDVHRMLLRGSAVSTQTTLQPAARAANVAGAFEAVEDCAGRHIILVDDVLTTGATAAECARALAQAGACCIRLITFARAFHIRGLSDGRG